MSLGRYPERGRYDYATVASILDDALICHIGFIAGDQPMVLPTAFGRIDRCLYVHASVLARWMNAVSTSMRVCVTVSLIDELVLARSAYRHSMNYRSVVAIADAQAVVDKDEKLAGLRSIVEHVCPGRWNDIRPPTDGEMKTTLVVRLRIAEASAKIRTGPPRDFDEDLLSGVWAGQIPLRTVKDAPIPDPRLEAGIQCPEYALGHK